MNRILILLVGLVLLASSCKKDEGSETIPPISAVPNISISALTPSSIDQFDDLEFTIFYQDGDGDLGFIDADENSLFITDNRFPLEHSFHVSPLSPPGSSITIQGEFKIVLQGVILKDQNSTSEAATFSVRMKDRAGNWSNVVTSAAVTIRK